MAIAQKDSLANRKIIIKAVFKLIMIVLMPLILFIALSRMMATQDNSLNSDKLLSLAYAAWRLDDENKVNLVDSKGSHSATAVNLKKVAGKSGKARYFNGENSYIKTPINFKGWKAFTVSLWVRPQRKHKQEISVILDNGHDAMNNFVIQSADSNNPNNGRWVWHFNGIDTFFNLPFNEWTNVVIVVDGKNDIIKAYASGVNVASMTVKNFEFGDTPLTIGKLAKSDSRYFKGSIDEVIILDQVLPDE